MKKLIALCIFLMTITSEAQDSLKTGSGLMVELPASSRMVLRPTASEKFAIKNGTENKFRIANTSDTTYKVRLKPNDTIRFQDADKTCAKILMINHGRKSLVLKLKPAASLLVSSTSEEVQFVSAGKGKIILHYRDTPKIEFKRDLSACPKTEKVSGDPDSFLICCNLFGFFSAIGALAADSLEEVIYCCDSTRVNFLKYADVKQGRSCFAVKFPAKSEKKEEAKSESPNRDQIGFNFRLYNDANGFNKDQTNALLQTEVSFNVQVKRKAFMKLGRCNYYFFKNVVFPTIRLAQLKSDSSFRYAPVHYLQRDNAVIDSSVNIHTLNLVRYSNFNVTAKINLLTIQSRNNAFCLYADVFGAYYRSGLSYDTVLVKHLGLEKEDSKFHVNSVGAGFNIRVRYAPDGSNFGLEASMTQFGLHLFSNDVTQNYGRLFNPDYNKKNDEGANLRLDQPFNSYFNGVGAYSFQIRYCKTQNKNNTMGEGFFFRVNFYNSPFVSLDGSHNVSYANNYVQIQTGISKSLEDLIGFLGLGAK